MPTRIRKQVDQLTLEDIRQHPVWEFCTDEEDVQGQDECTVRPVPLSDLRSRRYYMAYAIFRLADGSEFEGHLQPDAKISRSHPIIFTPGRRIPFWRGARVLDGKTLDQCYTTLGKAADQVFPITWSCEYANPGSPALEVITGFGYLEKPGMELEIR